MPIELCGDLPYRLFDLWGADFLEVAGDAVEDDVRCVTVRAFMVVRVPEFNLMASFWFDYQLDRHCSKTQIRFSRHNRGLITS